MNWLYLTLNLCSVAIPFAFSFEKKVSFFKKWKFLFPALFIVAAFFIIWDFWFTDIGIWKFNYQYLLGFNMGNLPFEEWLFFILIPYSCVFIHESLRYYVPTIPFENKGNQIAVGLSIVMFFLAIVFHDRMYPAVTFSLLGVMLLVNVFVLKSDFIGRFFFTYLVSCIPFCIVNGFLTAMPVLIYNNNENMGIRIGTIPVEDFFYSMLMLLMNITIYEYLMAKKRRTVS